MNEGVRSAGITPDQLAAVRRSEWFRTLEPGFQRAVLESSRVMVLAAGEAVFYRGDPCDGIYCVLSGAVRFGAVSPSGRESVVALVEGPEWFGEIALFDGGVRTHDVWADVASTVLHLPMRHLTRILAEHPGGWRQLVALLVRKLRVALSLFEDLALEPPQVRLARCLINLLEGYGRRKAEPPYRVRVSQERLGMMLSLTRQTVNELLGQLEEETIVEREMGRVAMAATDSLGEIARKSGPVDVFRS